MKPCPHCGVMLTVALVDAVRDETAEESCPKGDRIQLHLDGLADKAVQHLAAAILHDMRASRGAA